MKVEKFKVLLYLKKSEPDKTGKAPIMGRITLNRTMAQFSCKLSCTPGLWNARESRLNGKSREAVETNEKIERLLLAVHSAFNSLMERKKDFDATAVRDMFQGNAGLQMTLLKLLDRHNEEMKARVGVDRAPTTMSTYVYTRRTLAEFIKTEFKVSDLAFGQLNEQFIRDYQDFCLEKKKLAMETVRHYLSILKKICRIAYKEGHSEKYHFCHFKLPKQKETTPKALSRENFEKLRDLEIPEKRRSHVITRENLFQDDEGSLWLKYRRKKTDYLGRVKLLPEALALIGKYRDDTRITLFPPQDYHTLRANMKSLRLMAGLSQDLVYHMGRHSFASLVTLEEGVPIETISKMLGHSNIKTTQIYARVTPKRLFEDMDRFVEATRDLKLIL
ncbi:phage integrase SAM-like domain-containing protein [Parabacteroides distasonis]|uniref:phage integrase SAM-like domain-containing protein n=1 Tax=Parabacteroides distasonis TaxID=823 RepID=UPI003D0260C5